MMLAWCDAFVLDATSRRPRNHSAPPPTNEGLQEGRANDVPVIMRDTQAQILPGLNIHLHACVTPRTYRSRATVAPNAWQYL